MDCFNLTMPDGTALRVRRYGNFNAPRVLFCHGAGLASDGFRPFWEILAERHDVFVMDLRGHGENPPCPVETFSPDLLVSDFCTVVGAVQDGFGQRPLHGVLHSVAAAIGLRVATLLPNAFASLVLYEPALAPSPEEPDATFDALRKSAPASTMRRRANFSTLEELQHLLLTHGPPSRMMPEAALILAKSLLRMTPRGEFKLRCAPALEAAIYASADHFGLWKTLHTLAPPVLIMGGRLRETSEYTSSAAPRISEAGSFDLLTLPGLSHFGWLEQPVRLALMTEAFICGVDQRSSDARIKAKASVRDPAALEDAVTDVAGIPR